MMTTPPPPDPLLAAVRALWPSREWWTRFGKALGHAFDPGALDRPPSPEEGTTLDRIAEGLHRRGLADTAILLLSAHAPLSFWAGQAMRFATPFYDQALFAPIVRVAAKVLFGRDDVRVLTEEQVAKLADIFERRTAVEALIQRLETLRVEVQAPPQTAVVQAPPQTAVVHAPPSADIADGNDRVVAPSPHPTPSSASAPSPRP